MKNSKLLLNLLHQMQEKNQEKYLKHEDLLEVSKKTGIPLWRLYSTVTFYTMFSLKPRKKRIVRICRSLACYLEGAEDYFSLLNNKEYSSYYTIEESSCLGLCAQSPSVMVDEIPVSLRDLDGILKNSEKRRCCPIKTIQQGSENFKSSNSVIIKNIGNIDPETIEDYIKIGGYEGFKKALNMTPENVIETIKNSELRGRGGAGFPTGLKLETAKRAKDRIKYIICNADEGEPGTFKDRAIMENNPHIVIEGLLIGGYAIGARRGFIYLRGEYALSRDRLSKAIDSAYEKGFLGRKILGTDFSFDIEIITGAGSYICGEETALIESIEGKRGQARNRPPFPPECCGLWGKPTVVNNVETLANIPYIVKNGASWFKQIGVEGSYGTKLFSLIGDVNWKGVVEHPFGIPLSEVIENFAEGIKGGRLKCIILGGVSGSLIIPEEINTSIDFKSLAKIGAGPGSGSIVVLNETRNLLEVLKNIAYFFRHESCGRCITCRTGTHHVYRLIDKFLSGNGTYKDLKVLENLALTMSSASFCGLGQTAPNIIYQSLIKMRHEWEKFIGR